LVSEIKEKHVLSVSEKGMERNGGRKGDGVKKMRRNLRSKQVYNLRSSQDITAMK
jgi:hypothetical protein